MRVLSSALFLVVLPTSVTSTATSAEVFPAQRLRRKAAAVQKKQQTRHAEVPPALPALQSEEPEATGEVPAPMDAGSDGFPHLPAVSQMLSSASGTLKTVNNQASSLEARVVQAQMQIEAKLAKEKAAFEEKLKQQEANNRVVIETNANITAEIKRLQDGNANIRKNAHDVEEHSRLMRSQLHLLQARLGVAKGFLGKSLTSTDDSKSSLLEVLRGNAHRHGHVRLQASLNATRRADDDDDDDDDDDEKDAAQNSDKSQQDSEDKDDDDDDDSEGSGTSLLSVSMMVSHASGDAPAEAESSELAAAGGDVLAGAMSSSPEDLLTVLSQEVTHLAQQEKESAKKLKELFMRDFRTGAQRRKALLVQQKALIASRDSLLALQSHLKKAEAQLESTRTHLQDRLHGVGQYLQKLAHFAMAPQSEVPHLLEVLPKAVTMKEKLF